MTEYTVKIRFIHGRWQADLLELDYHGAGRTCWQALYNLACFWGSRS